MLVDFRTADDAGVYALDERTALVQTVDFFTPIVDDAFAYGAIAAANALSDIYAMGGVPVTALAVACLPRRGFDVDQARAIFLGGLETLQAAGVALLGGHTVQDEEVKFGYAVTGLVEPGRQWTNAGARVGDVLLLTKPLGTGVISTAIKAGRAADDVVEAAIRSMRALNRPAAEALRRAGDRGERVVGGCTDVTGFGLVGHASEMAAASGVQMRLRARTLPVLAGARELAPVFQPGGTATNRAHFGDAIRFGEGVDAVTRALCFDPQTSGGLLASVAVAQASAVIEAMRAGGVEVTAIGVVAARGEGDPLVVVDD